MNNEQVTEKLNEGLYKHLLAHIINGTITIEIIKSYLKIIKMINIDHFLEIQKHHSQNGI